jgi:hypothetical protein
LLSIEVGGTEKEFSMTNFFKRFGVIAVVAIIGIWLAGCDNGTTDDDKGGGESPVNGTWIQGDSKLVLNNGSYTWWEDNIPQERGTYSITGGNVTIQASHMYYFNNWLDQSQSLATGNYTADDFLPYTGTYVFSNNNETLTISFWGTWIKF